MKRLLSILLIFVTTIMLTACSKEIDPNAKTFKEEDFEITLTNDFSKIELSGIKYYYEDKTNNVIAFVNVDSKQLFENAGINFPDDSEGYAKHFINVNKLDAKVTKKKDFAHFTYKTTVNGVEYYFYALTYKSGDNCWLVQFRCVSDKVNDLESQFDKWADTIVVK